MKKYVFTVFLLFLVGCATDKNSLSKNENVFNLNGKNISVSDKWLIELRGKWKGNSFSIITSSQLTKDDVQWSLDYISLIESINSKDCNSLTIIQTRKFDANNDIDLSGANIEPGLFDYIWEVGVCDLQRDYRLVNQKGDASFTLYPLNL